MIAWVQTAAADIASSPHFARLIALNHILNAVAALAVVKVCVCFLVCLTHWFSVLFPLSVLAGF